MMEHLGRDRSENSRDLRGYKISGLCGSELQSAHREELQPLLHIGVMTKRYEHVYFRRI
jgi:hypothetical protein